MRTSARARIHALSCNVLKNRRGRELLLATKVEVLTIGLYSFNEARAVSHHHTSFQVRRPREIEHAGAASEREKDDDNLDCSLPHG